MIEILNRRIRRYLIPSSAALAAGLVLAGSAHAAAPVPLGTADSFALLAGSTITNTGPTTITGDIGLCCTGTAMTGFASVTQPGGATVRRPRHAGGDGAPTISTSPTADAAGRAITRTLPVDLSLSGTPATPLLPGVYESTAHGVLQINTGLTLDFQGDPNAVFIFQGTTLTTAAAAGGLGEHRQRRWRAERVQHLLAALERRHRRDARDGQRVQGHDDGARRQRPGHRRDRAGADPDRRSKAVTLDTNTITRSGCSTETETGGGGGDTTTTPSTTTTPTQSTTTPSAGTRTPGDGMSGDGGGATGGGDGGSTDRANGGRTPGDDTDGGGGTGDGARAGGGTASGDTGGSTTSGDSSTGTLSGESTDGLPFTGFNVLWLLLGAVALLGTGTALRRVMNDRS